MGKKPKKSGGVRITASINMKEDYQKLLQIIELVDMLMEMIPEYREEESKAIYRRIIKKGESMIIVSEEEI